MLAGTGHAPDREAARELLEKTISDGSALKKLAEFVEAQGGDSRAVYDTSLQPQAAYVEEIPSPADGFVAHIEADEVGVASLLLGGGRETKESVIDLSVGLILKKKVGDSVKKGENLAQIYANDRGKMENAANRFLSAYTLRVLPGTEAVDSPVRLEFSDSPVEKRPLIHGIVTGDKGSR